MNYRQRKIYDFLHQLWELASIGAVVALVLAAAWVALTHPSL